MSKTYFLFHDPCMDGLGAKFAAWTKFGNNAEYVGVNYGQPVPVFEPSSDIIIADFSYTRDVLRELKARAKSLIVLDHHKTAEEELRGEPYAIFDMQKSGAVLAWEYLHPGVPVPRILLHIQDRDIWKWELPFSKEVLASLSIKTKDVSKWKEECMDMDDMKKEGEAISKYQQSVIKTISEPKNCLVTEYGGNKVAIINNTNMNSEVLSELASNTTLDVDYSIGYVIQPNGVVLLSFRSNGNEAGGGFDVSAEAKKLGGGGHRNASGARVDFKWLENVYNQPHDVLHK